MPNDSRHGAVFNQIKIIKKIQRSESVYFNFLFLFNSQADFRPRGNNDNVVTRVDKSFHHNLGHAFRAAPLMRLIQVANNTNFHFCNNCLYNFSKLSVMVAQRYFAATVSRQLRLNRLYVSRLPSSKLILSAISLLFFGSTNRPLTPISTTERTPFKFVAMTGLPQAMASISTMPNASELLIDGKIKTSPKL